MVLAPLFCYFIDFDDFKIFLYVFCVRKLNGGINFSVGPQLRGILTPFFCYFIEFGASKVVLYVF